MNNPTIEAILDLPQDEQLAAALEIIRTLTDPHTDYVGMLNREFGLTGKQSMLLNFLYQARNMRTKEAIFTAIWGYDAETGIKIIDVMVSKLRAILGKDSIVTTWGSGYGLSKEMLATLDELHEAYKGEQAVVKRTKRRGPIPLQNRRTPWSMEDDQYLLDSLAEKTPIPEIAQNLGRTERAVIDRKALYYSEGKTATALRATYKRFKDAKPLAA